MPLTGTVRDTVLYIYHWERGNTGITHLGLVFSQFPKKLGEFWDEDLREGGKEPTCDWGILEFSWGKPALGRVQQHPTESWCRRDPVPETGKLKQDWAVQPRPFLNLGKKKSFLPFLRTSWSFVCIPAAPVGPGAIPNHPRAGLLYLLHVWGGAFPSQNEWCGLLLGSALAPGSLPEAESGFYGRLGQGCGVWGWWSRRDANLEGSGV